MGNENTIPEKHVSFDDDFESPRSTFRDPRQRTGDRVDGFLEDQRTRQTRTPVRMDISANEWSERPVGGVKQQRTKEWLHYDDVEDNDDLGQRWQQPRPAQRPPLHTFGRPNVTEETWHDDGYDAASFHSIRRPVNVAPNSRFATTTYSPMNSRVTRSYHSTDFQRSPSRAFTRDPNDPWYNYRPVVNRRADWALVGRHVLRPTSASGSHSRVFYDNDSASSDPTSNRVRQGMWPELVRRTDNPRVQKGTRTVYWEEEDDTAYGRWPGQTSVRYQRPTNYVYHTYRR